MEEDAPAALGNGGKRQAASGDSTPLHPTSIVMVRAGGPPTHFRVTPRPRHAWLVRLNRTMTMEEDAPAALGNGGKRQAASGDSTPLHPTSIVMVRAGGPPTHSV